MFRNAINRISKERVINTVSTTTTRVGVSAFVGGGLFYSWSKVGNSGHLGTNTPFPTNPQIAALTGGFLTGISAIPRSNKRGAIVAALGSAVVTLGSKPKITDSDEGLDASPAGPRPRG